MVTCVTHYFEDSQVTAEWYISVMYDCHWTDVPIDQEIMNVAQ